MRAKLFLKKFMLRLYDGERQTPSQNRSNIKRKSKNIPPLSK